MIAGRQPATQVRPMKTVWSRGGANILSRTATHFYFLSVTCSTVQKVLDNEILQFCIDKADLSGPICPTDLSLWTYLSNSVTPVDQDFTHTFIWKIFSSFAMLKTFQVRCVGGGTHQEGDATGTKGWWAARHFFGQLLWKAASVRTITESYIAVIKSRLLLCFPVCCWPCYF